MSVPFLCFESGVSSSHLTSCLPCVRCIVPEHSLAVCAATRGVLERPRGRGPGPPARALPAALPAAASPAPAQRPPPACLPARLLICSERNDGLYRVITFLCAKMLEELGLALLCSIIFSEPHPATIVFHLWLAPVCCCVPAAACAAMCCTAAGPQPPGVRASTAVAARSSPPAAQPTLCGGRWSCRAALPSSGSHTSSPSQWASVRCCPAAAAAAAALPACLPLACLLRWPGAPRAPSC